MAPIGQPPLPPNTSSAPQPSASSHGYPSALPPHHNPTSHGGGSLSTPPNTMQAADRIILEFFRRRGYKEAEAAFLTSSHKDLQKQVSLDDAEVDDSLRQILLILKDPAQIATNDIYKYIEAYNDLHEWVQNSLDVYKPQLASCLYPLLIHSFLEMIRRDNWFEARQFLQENLNDFININQVIDQTSTKSDCNLRRQELFSLFGIASAQHIDENDVAKLYLNNRYEIYMSYYAFELLLAFLAEDQRRSVLLRILNKQCRIRFDTASDGAPFAGFRKDNNSNDQSSPQDSNNNDKTGIIPDDEKFTALKDTEIIWGRLRPEHYIMNDEESIKVANMKKNEKLPSLSKKNSEKSANKQDQKKDSNNNQNNNPNNNNPSLPNLSKNPNALPVTTPPGGEDEDEVIVRDDGTINRSRIPLKRYRKGAAGLETSADLKARARLQVSEATNDGIRRDLAILFYTITNTRNDGLNCCTVSEDGSQLIGGFGDSSIRVWDARASGTMGSSSGGLNSKPLRLIGHNGPVFGVDITKCGRYLISCGEDGMIRLWNISLKSELVTYRGHNFPIWDLKFSPVDHYFVSAAHDRTARIWSTDRLHPLRILSGHLSDVDCCNWHPNVNYVATGSADRCVRIWDVRDGQCAKVYRTGSCGSLNAVTFSPDGKTVCAAGDGSIIKVWDLRSNNGIVNNNHHQDGCIKQLNGHRSAIWSLNYSRDGAVLASGGADWRVCVWRAEEWSSVVGYDDAEGAGQDAEQQQHQANGSGKNDDTEGKTNLDGDGDVNMDGGGSNKGSNDKAKQNAKNTNPAMKNGRNSGRLKSDAANWNNVPLVEAFETKATPVQVVKFTRRNLLIAAGSFST